MAALYTGLFAVSVVVLGVITLLATRSALSREFDRRIAVEATALAQEYRSEGLEEVLQAVRERDLTPGALDYGLEAAGGRPLAGRLAGKAAPVGWSVVKAERLDGEGEAARVLVTELPGGLHLIVGDDIERVSDIDTIVLRGFAAALAGVLLLGLVGGYALSRDTHRRLSAMSGAAEAIIDGDLSRRIPHRGTEDDLDRLAATFNRMLDRIDALLESLRQVSNDVAHDLRTPLTRLRQRLETSLDTAPGPAVTATIEQAMADLDAILETFAALLRIAQIEAGARRAGFREVDLARLCAHVVEAFAPSAEEGRRTLSLEVREPAVIEGDAELLTQMVVNLVENALIHTPSGSTIRVVVTRAVEGAELSVCDDGPGVPAAERERVFDRFYRLQESRSEPGNGLGLALVAAVARLHDARVGLHDAGPGLEARVTFGTRRGAGATLGSLNAADMPARRLVE